jgi:hypothetical protein
MINPKSEYLNPAFYYVGLSFFAVIPACLHPAVTSEVQCRVSGTVSSENENNYDSRQAGMTSREEA